MAYSSQNFYYLENLIKFKIYFQIPPQTGPKNLTYPRISFLNFLNLTTSCDISNYNKTCGSDWVEVRSVSNQLDLGGPRYCCSSFPSQIVSSSNETIVLFYSSGQSKGGFAANTYYAISKEFIKYLVLFIIN